jgi:hypothetical protein
VNFTRKSPAVILAAEHRRRRRQNKDAAAVSVITSSKVLSSLPSTAVKTAGPETTTDGIPHCQPDPVTVSIRHTDPALTRPSTYPGQTLPQLNNDTCDPRRATRIPDSTFTAPVEERTSMPFQPQSVTFWTNGDRPSNPMSRAMMSLSVMRPNVHTQTTMRAVWQFVATLCLANRYDTTVAAKKTLRMRRVRCRSSVGLGEDEC